MAKDERDVTNMRSEYDLQLPMLAHRGLSPCGQRQASAKAKSASTTMANHPQGWDAKPRVLTGMRIAGLPNGVVHAKSTLFSGRLTSPPVPIIPPGNGPGGAKGTFSSTSPGNSPILWTGVACHVAQIRTVRRPIPCTRRWPDRGRVRRDARAHYRRVHHCHHDARHQRPWRFHKRRYDNWRRKLMTRILPKSQARNLKPKDSCSGGRGWRVARPEALRRAWPFACCPPPRRS
jgi:hypothetical protein